MRRMRTSDSDPAPGLTELPFHVLLALGDGPSHGYAIGKDVEERSWRPARSDDRRALPGAAAG